MKGMGMIVNFAVLPCFLPKLHTLAAKEAHIIEKPRAAEIQSSMV
ncbi:uncharacterized protein METZ01_LOCUS229589, partial [marine metagenome]